MKPSMPDLKKEDVELPELVYPNDIKADELLSGLGLKNSKKDSAYVALFPILRTNDIIIDSINLADTNINEKAKNNSLSRVSVVAENNSLIRITVVSLTGSTEVTLVAHFNSEDKKGSPVDADFIAETIRKSAAGNYFKITVSKKTWERLPLATPRTALCSWLLG